MCLVNITKGGIEGAHGAGANLHLPIAQSGALERWFGVWEKSNQLFRDTDSLNLDRKQVILDTFLSIEDAARS